MDQSARADLHRCKRRKRHGLQLEPGTCQPQRFGTARMVPAHPQGRRPDYGGRFSSQGRIADGKCQNRHVVRWEESLRLFAERRSGAITASRTKRRTTVKSNLTAPRLLAIALACTV